MKQQVQSPEVATARRALRSFIARILVDVEAKSFMIEYHPEAITGFLLVPPRRFELLYQA